MKVQVFASDINPFSSNSTKSIIIKLPDKCPCCGIESASLSACISTYINNEKIKTLARASAWIGNDETHYVRKHQNYNVQDLKRFINTVVAFIEYEHNYTEALNLLSDPQ